MLKKVFYSSIFSKEIKLRVTPINIQKKRFRRKLKSKEKKKRKRRLFHKLNRKQIRKCMDYEKRVKLLLKKKIIESEKEVFYPNKNDSYNELSDFYQNYLEKKSFNFSRPIFFFGSEESLNAWAWKNSGLDVICINQHAIVFINKLFKEHHKFIFGYLKQNNICTHYDNILPASTIMKQMIEMFLFYHELGHLIQEQSPVLTSTFIEENNEKEEFELMDHVSEFDADIFASVRLATHIFMVYKRQNGLNTNQKKKHFLEDLCIISIASYTIYRLELFPDYGAFYTSEGTHPHIIFRISLLQIHLTKAIVGNLNLELSRGRIFNESIKFVESFSNQNSTKCQVESFIKMGRDNMNEIINYTHKVNDIVVTAKGSAHVKSQKKIR